MGSFVHDHRRAMMAFGLISCILMGGLITIGPDWAEGLRRCGIGKRWKVDF